MALFMDIHTMDGPVSAEQVAGAHRADLDTQGRYGVDYRQYWVDEEHGRIFCLVEAPDADAAISVHREAHGLVADAIFPVAEGSSPGSGASPDESRPCPAPSSWPGTGISSRLLFGPWIPAKAANRHARADHAPGREHR